MKTKTVKVLYWSLLIIFSISMLFDGIGALARSKAGQEVLIHLGYPLYVLTILGIAKFCGVFAILQTKFKTIKEWAFAGFAINFFGGFASRLFVGDKISAIIFPVIVIALMFFLYFLWKKYEQIKTL